MKKILSFIGLVLLLTACSSTPEPLSWKNDLADLKAEPINDGLQTKDVLYELHKKSVWKAP